jgi:hypothetical protein
MQRTSRLVMGVLSLSLLTSLPVFAAPPGSLPPAQTQGTVTYVSGGIGQEEAQAFAAATRYYPLTLEFAVKHLPHAAFTAKVPVRITDTRGHIVLATQSDGPFLLAKLPAGYYTVTAEQHGQALTKTIHITPAQPAHVLFLWAT